MPGRLTPTAEPSASRAIRRTRCAEARATSWQPRRRRLRATARIRQRARRTARRERRRLVGDGRAGGQGRIAKASAEDARYDSGEGQATVLRGRSTPTGEPASPALSASSTRRRSGPRTTTTSCRSQQQLADLVPVSPFWLDYARHDGKGAVPVAAPRRRVAQLHRDDVRPRRARPAVRGRQARRQVRRRPDDAHARPAR